MRENKFKSDLIKDVKNLFPDCMVLNTDAGYIQGIPDMLILYKNKWAALEVKRNLKAPRQPNQEYYVEALDKMSFASFICPENKKEVLNELQRALQSNRAARVSKRE
jgi:hypothetical protein